MSHISDEPEEVQKQYLKIATNYALPIFWIVGGTIANNGTAFILDTGVSTFVVTAGHVYAAYKQAKSEHTVDSCRLLELEFELEGRCISYLETSAVDLATFSISDDELETFRSRILRGAQEKWPPQRAKAKGAAVIAGFPGVERVEQRTNNVKEVSFGSGYFNIPVTTVSENRFSCQFDRGNWYDPIGIGIAQQGVDLGGLSGAPALSFIKSGTGIVTWALAGVVYQAINSEDMGEILLIQHACWIGADGIIVNPEL